MREQEKLPIACVRQALASEEYLAAHKTWERAWAACETFAQKHPDSTKSTSGWRTLHDAALEATHAYKVAFNAEAKRQYALLAATPNSDQLENMRSSY